MRPFLDFLYSVALLIINAVRVPMERSVGYKLRHVSVFLSSNRPEHILLRLSGPKGQVTSFGGRTVKGDSVLQRTTVELSHQEAEALYRALKPALRDSRRRMRTQRAASLTTAYMCDALSSRV